MEEEEILLLSATDLHIADNNTEECKELMFELIDTAECLSQQYIYILGDVFQSRKYQTLKVLEAFQAILDRARSKHIIFRIIPGNHDKPNYNEERSYLDLYKGYDSLELVKDYKCFSIKGYNVHMIPFFDEKESYTTYLSLCLKYINDNNLDKNILLTHIAVNGVRNNDGSVVEEGLKKDIFKLFLKVYIGHYHDEQEFDNFHYIGAIKQKNFGEDNKKGFVLIKKDLSIERIIPNNVKWYKTIDIDVDTTDSKEINLLLEENKNSKDNIRFSFKGKKEKLKSVDRSIFEKNGISVKMKETIDLSIESPQLTEEFQSFNKESIKKEWIEFCTINKIGKENDKKGNILLNKELK